MAKLGHPLTNLERVKLIELSEAIDTAFTLLPKAVQTFRAWDKTLGKWERRKRGDRTKLQGGELLEEAAVGAVKVLKTHFIATGYSTFDAQKSAYKIVAKLVGVSPATLEDWYRGVQRRERRKPLDQRRYSRRNQKRD